MNQQQNPAYQGYIVAFMSFLHEVHYERTATFPAGVLGLVTPNDVKRWMCYKAFGLEEPKAVESTATLAIQHIRSCEESTFLVYAEQDLGLE